MNLPAIIRELPENVAHVYLAANNIPQEERDALALQATGRGLELIDHHGDVNAEEGLLELAKMAEHIIVLGLNSQMIRFHNTPPRGFKKGRKSEILRRS